MGMRHRMRLSLLVLLLVAGFLSPTSPAIGDQGDSVSRTPPSVAPAARRTDSEIGATRQTDRNSLDPKVVRYAERVLEQLGSDDPRGLPLELWPDGQEAVADWDTDRDEFLSARELARAIHTYSRNRTLRVLAIPAPPTGNGQPAASQAGIAGEEETSPGRNGLDAEEPPAGVEPDGAGSDEPAARAETDRSDARGPRRGNGRSNDDAVFQVAPARLAAGAPPWFLELDKDGDGQVTLSEFAPEPTGQAISEFRRLDWNNDGVITLEEARRGPQPAEAPTSGRGGRR